MKVIIACDNVERAFFFRRVVRACSELNFFIIGVDPVLYLVFRRIKNCKVFVLKKPWVNKKEEFSGLLCEELNSYIDCFSMSASKEKAVNEMASIYYKIRDVIASESPDIAIIWNGQRPFSKVFSLCCSDLHVKTKFLEISNFPNKLFSDPDGVNARSRVAHHPDILDAYPGVQEGFHESWLKTYRSYKEKGPPQANSKSVEHFFLLIVNRAFKYLSKGYFVDDKSVFELIASVLKKRNSIDYISSERIDVPYVFVPLQVSTDTQLVCNSDIDNVGLINIAINRARDIGCSVVVKIHPAEKSVSLMKEVAVLAGRHDIILSARNTIELIESAEKVLTINSTVGLEALILGVPVEVYGRALYEGFDIERAKKYLHYYLIDELEYFSKGAINPSAVLQIVENA